METDSQKEKSEVCLDLDRPSHGRSYIEFAAFGCASSGNGTRPVVVVSNVADEIATQNYGQRFAVAGSIDLHRITFTRFLETSIGFSSRLKTGAASSIIRDCKLIPLYPVMGSDEPSKTSSCASRSRLGT
jgi:hypothetical protein